MSESSPPGADDGLSGSDLAVTRRLLTHGPASRGDLGRELALSEASMSRVARRLMDDGLVTQTSQPTGGMGRPMQLLSAVAESRSVIGIKLTHDTAFGVACDLFANVTDSEEVGLPAAVRGSVPVAPAIKVIAKLISRLGQRAERIDAVGISVGGVVVDQARVEHAVFLGWREVDLAYRVQRSVDKPVVVSNDVSALAQEQLWFGAGRTHSTFGLITVGAGLGFGVVREGRVVERTMDNGHLLAHSPVDTTGPVCSLGHAGCASVYLNPWDIAAGSRGRGQNRRPRHNVQGAARALGHLTATMAGALQTDRIVLAGEDVAAISGSPAMTEVIAERLRQHADETEPATLDVTTSSLTFHDWARGAAVVAVQRVLGAT